MKNIEAKICNFLVLGAVCFAACGCASNNEMDYFSSVNEAAKKLQGDNEDITLSIGDFISFMCDEPLTGGASEENGCFTYYINEDEAYYEFDLSNLIDDTKEQHWEQAGAFRREEENATYLCWSNMDVAGDTNSAHDVMIVRFDTDNTADYDAWIYELEDEYAYNRSISCYGLDGSIYVMWLDTRGLSRLSVIDGSMASIKSLDTAASLLDSYVQEQYDGSAWNYCVLSDDGGVTIYGAEVREQSDAEQEALVFMAVSDGEEQGFMSIVYE